MLALVRSPIGTTCNYVLHLTQLLLRLKPGSQKYHPSALTTKLQRQDKACASHQISKG